jgi:hypothetical protein
MIIDELLTVLSAPENPVETGANQNWGKVTNQFGQSLPGDYMMFIDRFGSGQIGDWLTVLNPFSKNRRISLSDQFFAILSGVSSLKSEYPETCPFPLFFEPGGLLPWGLSIDGDIFCWKTDGPSGRWTTVVLGRHSGPELHELSCTQFIARIITGETSSAAVPSEWRELEVKFLPIVLPG